MSRQLDVAPELAVLVGADHLRDMLAGPFPDEYRCIDCSTPGSVQAGTPTSLVAIRYADGARLMLRHATCGPSQLIERPAETFDGALSDEAEASATPVVLRAGPPHAMLLCASSRAFFARPHLDESVAMQTTTLLNDGFTLLLDESLLPAGVQPVDGWLVEVAGPLVRVGREHGATFVLFDGELDPPQMWVDAIRSEGACVVAAGDGMSLDGDPAEGFAHAIRQGRVAAGVVRAVVRG